MYKRPTAEEAIKSFKAFIKRLENKKEKGK